MANFSNTAYVARTSFDQTHVNRLCVPEFGVVEIRIKKGGSGSLSHRLPGVSTPRAPTGAGADNFNFAPGYQFNPGPWTEDPARNDRVKVWYDLYNPLLNITKAKLELFSRFNKSAVWERKLEGDELEDGEHDLEFQFESGGTKQKRAEWDGAIDSGGAFPDGFLTVDQSPYKLRLIVEGPGQCQAQIAWTYFHVVIHHLELDWGPENAIPSSTAVRRQPFHDLLNPRGGGPAPTPTTANIPIYLNSALFMSRGWFHASSSQMFDNTLFDKYEDMWGDGPEIPLFCKIWIRDSSGTAVIAPKAIGRTKFLWDWESRSAAVASAFVNDAQNYDIAVTQPPGQNCHKDRGGKRGASRAVFPKQGGYSPRATLKTDDFPFEVKPCPSPRKWAVYSYAWRESSLAGKTGVLLQPSRMAGDKFRITVYAAHETADGSTPRLQINSAAPLPIDASLKAISGDFEIWRRVPLIRYLKKTAAVTNLTFATIAAYYQPAFLDLVDDSGGASTYPSGDWNTNIKSAISDWSSKQQLMVDPAVDQHASGNDGILLRSRAQFRAAMVASGVNPADATTWMNGNGMSNVVSYAQLAQGLTRAALVKVFDKKFRKDVPGVNISQVAVVHSLIGAALAAGLTSMVDGEAADYPSSDENHSAFLSLLDPTQRGALGFASTSEITASHEFGHLFFLPHPAPVNGESGYNAHDTTPGVNNCVMSYWAGGRVFCGLCQLRLRGWDKSVLKTTQINHKP